MVYLLDASVVIVASNSYYQLDRIPQFWAWASRHIKRGIIKMPAEIRSEIKPSQNNALLMQWLAETDAELVVSETVSSATMREVLTTGYGFSAINSEVLAFAHSTQDPTLIAYALSHSGQCCVVTLEKDRSNPRSLPLPRNRKIPLVCRLLDIPCINAFELIRELDFRISSSVSAS